MAESDRKLAEVLIIAFTDICGQDMIGFEVGSVMRRRRRVVKARAVSADGLPGRNEARTGLRMMPTFPRSPLKFRKAGFTRYGFKAGKSGGTFPATRGLRVARLASALRAPRISCAVSSF